MSLTLTIEGVAASFDVRRLQASEQLNGLFALNVTAVSDDAAIPTGTGAAAPAVVSMAWNAQEGTRTQAWSGICIRMTQVRAEPDGVSTYMATIAPRLWLLGKRVNYRLFQHMTIVEMVTVLLDEWKIEASYRLSNEYPKLELRTQYAETDYAFFKRLLEEAGITFFHERDDSGSKLVLSDCPHNGPQRPSLLNLGTDDPLRDAEEYALAVQLVGEVRCGAAELLDYDFRQPALSARSKITSALGDARLERADYWAGAMVVEKDAASGTPVADEQGAARHDLSYGAARMSSVVAGEVSQSPRVEFVTNALDVAPGIKFSVAEHPHAELSDRPLLCDRLELDVTHDGRWQARCRALFADKPIYPLCVTPRPRVEGVVTATVVGPDGHEIHCDEFGRVRVKFPWDRRAADAHSSCWVRVSQGWAGGAYGMLTLPRIGHEVLVSFVAGNPDQPIVSGRLFNSINDVPYKLPDHKTRSTLRSRSSPASAGFNELMFEDRAGDELVLLHAERDREKTVKNDERMIVGRNRSKLVEGNEDEQVNGSRSESVNNTRTEHTGAQRTIFTGGSHMLTVGGDLAHYAAADGVHRFGGRMMLHVEEEQHVVVKKEVRRSLGSDVHQTIGGGLLEDVAGTVSRTVGEDQHMAVGGLFAVDAGDEVHVRAANNLVIECDTDISLIGPGGFIRIDASGIVIEGKLVKINCGGSAGQGSGAFPEAPQAAEEVAAPEASAEPQQGAAEQEAEQDAGSPAEETTATPATSQ